MCMEVFFMLTKFDPSKLEGLTREEKDKTIGFDFDWKILGAEGDAVLKKHHALLFKWSGVYNQLQKGFYMMRIRVPGGAFSTDQCRIVADLSRKYAQEDICITTRQTLQFHWVKLQYVSEIFRVLHSNGMTTKNACGDVPRNICCCQWSGVCPVEKINAREVCMKTEEAVTARDELRNLPRKFKINFSGCEAACGQPYTNDVGWVGTVYNAQTGFMLFGCGGLGSRPFLGKKIFDFVPAELVTQVTLAMGMLFRVWGNRQNRAYARSKYVMKEFGLQKYQDLLFEYIAREGVNPEDISRIIPAEDNSLDPVPDFIDKTQAVIPQAGDDRVLLQIQVPRGELTADQLDSLSTLADDNGDGYLYFTQRQNVEIHSITMENIDAVIDSVHDADLFTDGFQHIRDAVSCVGTTFCNLAVANTPNVYREILDTLGERDDYLENIHHILINMNGCPNSCGQHKIADIGLRGMRLPSQSGSVEAFELSLGGSIYDGVPSFNEPVGTMPASICVSMIERILDTYLAQRSSDTQSFRQFYEDKGRKFFVDLLVASGCRPPKGVLSSSGSALENIPKGHEITSFSDLHE